MAYTFDMINTVDMVFTIDMVHTVDIIHTIDVVYAVDMVYSIEMMEMRGMRGEGDHYHTTTAPAVLTNDGLQMCQCQRQSHQEFHTKMKIVKSSLVRKLILLVPVGSVELAPLVQGGHLQLEHDRELLKEVNQSRKKQKAD